MIDRHQTACFTWGTYDCATLLADCVAAMTGADPLRKFGVWHDRATARRVLRAAGHARAEDWVRATFAPIPVGLAGRGDLGYPPGPREPLMLPAVIVGAVAVSWSEQGWCAVSRADIAEAFEV